jgi:hypothetical protein
MNMSDKLMLCYAQRINSCSICFES